PHGLYQLLKKDPAIRLHKLNQLGSQYLFRPNWLVKPFDDPRVREALWYAFNQEDFLNAAIGDSAYYTTCKAYFICGTPLASEEGTEGLLTSNFVRARALLKEEQYDGNPIVLLHSTDLNVLANLPPVARQLLERAGFTVDLQSM